MDTNHEDGSVISVIPHVSYQMDIFNWLSQHHLKVNTPKVKFIFTNKTSWCSASLVFWRTPPFHYQPHLKKPGKEERKLIQQDGRHHTGYFLSHLASLNPHDRQGGCLVQFSHSVVADSCNPMDCSMPGLPVHHHLPEFTQTHVHWVSDDIQPSHPLSFPFPPAFNLSRHQVLFKWVTSLNQVAKVLVFQLQHQSLQWTPMTDLS